MPETLTEQPAILPRSQSKAAHVPPEAPWQVLAYLAADNDLEGELLSDLAEMERVGSTPGVVEVLAQVDRSRGQDTSKGNWYGTRRYYVTRGTDPRKINSRLLADLGPTNTGDPRVLEGFIRFGAQRYPAQATALVLLNHGSGFYVPPEMRGWRRVQRSGGPRRKGTRVGGHLYGRICRGVAPPPRGPHGDPGGLEVRAGRLAPHARRLLDPPKRPAQPPKCQNVLSFVVAQEVGHAGERDHSPSRRANVLSAYPLWPVLRCRPMAGFGCRPRPCDRNGPLTRSASHATLRSHTHSASGQNC
jgi:hypothetical protein